MSNQKGFSKIAIIIIVLILIGGGYFVFSKKDRSVSIQDTENQNSQSSNLSIDQLSTDNWKTYKNDRYGFEVKYPSSPSVLVISPNNGEYWKIGNNYTIKWNTFNIRTDADVPVEVGLRVYDKISGEELHSYVSPKAIAHVTNSGLYTWTVPSVFVAKNLAGLALEEVDLTQPNNVYKVSVIVFLPELSSPDAEASFWVQDESDTTFSIVQ